MTLGVRSEVFRGKIWLKGIALAGSKLLIGFSLKLMFMALIERFRFPSLISMISIELCFDCSKKASLLFLRKILSVV